MQLFFCQATTGNDNGIPVELNTLIIVMDYTTYIRVRLEIMI